MGNPGSRRSLLFLPVIVCLLPAGQPFPSFSSSEFILASELGQLFFFFLSGMFFHHQLTCCSLLHSRHSMSDPSGRIPGSCGQGPSSSCREPPGTYFSLTLWLTFFTALTLRGLSSCVCISLSASRHTALEWVLWCRICMSVCTVSLAPTMLSHHKCTRLSSSLKELCKLGRIHTRRRKAAAVPLLLLLSGHSRSCTTLFSSWCMDSVPLWLETAPLRN